MPRVIHLEIPVENIDRAREFYTSVFGWEILKWKGPFEYWMVMTGEKSEEGIDGGLILREKKLGEGGFNAFVCTVEVESLDSYVSKVIDSGGSIVGEKMTIPQVGYMAYCHDTEGNTFGLMQSDELAK